MLGVWHATGQTRAMSGIEITRIGEFVLGWGESLVWDERRSRLYFVDCAARTLHWLDGLDGDLDGTLSTLELPSMAAGIVPADDGRLVGALDDGLHVIDPDTGASELLAAYPDELGGRCNDMCADPVGRVITGKLNMGPAEGSAWQWSVAGGWRMIDPDISNTNGPTVGIIGGTMTLVIGDTSVDYFRYDYDPATGAVGERSVFGATGELDGVPDGATLDADGGLWCALVGGGQLARFSADGLDRTLALPLVNPTDVTFGGPDLDRLFVVSIAPTMSPDPSAPAPASLDGTLLVVDHLGTPGRPEPRASLTA
jgi:sugar lactone lactonase YvrE